MRSVNPSDLTARARIRQAALRLFAQHGSHATSTRAIAAEAGVSVGLVIHHFGSKEGLRTAVEDEVLQIFDAALDDLEQQDATNLLSALAVLSVRLFAEDPTLRGYLRHALLDESETGAALFARLVAGARRELQRLSSVGGLRDDADLLWAPYQMLFLILGPLLLEQVMQPALDGAVFDPEVVVRRSSANQRLLMHGILACSERPPLHDGGIE
jgi:AcrR family transcriptional regulator